MAEDCFEHAVKNYCQYIIDMRKKALAARALGTVEFLTACLSTVINCAERVRVEERESTPDAKLTCFSIIVGCIADSIENRDLTYGGMYRPDTTPKSFNTGDILGYEGPAPHEP